MKLLKIFVLLLIGAIFAFGMAVWLGWPFPISTEGEVSLSSVAIPNWKGVFQNAGVWLSTYGVWIAIARQLYRTVKHLVIIGTLLILGILVAVGYFFHGFDRLSVLFGM